jgi:hypothetical protein
MRSKMRKGVVSLWLHFSAMRKCEIIDSGCLAVAVFTRRLAEPHGFPSLVDFGPTRPFITNGQTSNNVYFILQPSRFKHSCNLRKQYF